ncbi:Hypothetical predicted protein, partial [Paramuricea clavata]
TAFDGNDNVTIHSSLNQNMPRKERCKKFRENLLKTAASGTQKLSSFGFATTSVSHDSSDIDKISPSSNSQEKEILPCCHTAGNVITQFYSETTSDHCEVTLNLPKPGLISDAEPQNQIVPAETSSDKMPTIAAFQTHDFEVCTKSATTTDSNHLLSKYNLDLDPTDTFPPKTYVQANKSSPENCDSRLTRHVFPWATYCMTRGTIACFHCKKATERNLITFSYHTEKAFSLGEFCNWKKCHEKFEKHQNSHCHHEAVEKLARLDHEKNDIGAQLDSQYQGEQNLHQRLFLKQLSSLKYLVRQGIPLRGHDSLDSNLIQLLKTRSEDIPELNGWVRNGQYLSPLIINELIEMMGNSVLPDILRDIRDNSGLFSLLADESRDISNKEQLTCIIRWVSLPDLEINEDFIGMYLINKPNAETIATSLKDIVKM